MKEGGLTERQSDTQSNITKSFRGSQRDLQKDTSQVPVVQEEDGTARKDDDAACKCVRPRR